MTKKGEPRTWKNARGEGILLNIDLIDREGTQIQATFFGKPTIDKWGPLLHENHVYLLSNGQIRLANKKFTSIKNDYCLIFDENSDIKEEVEDKEIGR